MKTTKTILFSLSVLLMSCFAAYGGETLGHKENTEKIVAYLIDQVAKSNLTFSRNGTEYSSQEAAEHMRRKYDYFRAQIETIDDFIHGCAAKSLMSGEPYLVSTAQGKIPVEKWLGELLMKHGNQPKHF